MGNKPDWIPTLVYLADYGGNWDSYLIAIYKFFRRDFIDSQPKFRGERLKLKRYPVIDGKEATFWHIISEGSYEPGRLPNLRKCERICWPHPIIESQEKEPLLKIWENTRDGETRICIWLSFDTEDYLVVIAKRKGYLLFWTAYPLIYENTKNKLQKEYDAYKARAAL